jgi:hypothetical protein
VGVVRPLVTTAIVLLVLSTIARAILHGTGHDVVKGFIPLFSVTEAGNIPALFQVALLAIAAWLLALTWAAERASGAAGRWLGFAVIVAGVACFTATDLQRWVGMLIAPTVLPTVPQLFALGWVIPHAIVAVVALLYLAPLIKQLGPESRASILMAAVLYVTAAVLLDGIRLKLSQAEQWRSVLYTVIVTTKVAGQMIGSIMLIRGLVARAAERGTIIGVSAD